ncbi:MULTISPECIES: TerC family protein [Shewanella]|uniref:Membrane protein n=2 Tax=Shewanella TaxID=22 RepID=A0ABQ1JSE6_9GAMM|nr:MULTISPECIES: TerC family protein [Shewanella]MCL1149206.1 TerC family protein [Shewanella ulleungensis]MCL1159442.1 TerC family protein [Shewanella inventionis]UAL41474.1 TerC family protein [Shewanella inventionis]GGB73412.1 membrane protein [Shewanella inventionis]GGP72913.1 membrane protein [Shewanella ulleungensis]
MFEWIADPQAWVALITLIGLEIVLGIDNIIFISIVVSKLPVSERDKARKIGIGLAMFARLALLLSLYWIMGLVEPIFTILEQAISGRDLILIFGGLFLLAKSTHEIHSSFEVPEDSQRDIVSVGFYSVLIQIAVLDIVFSLDSVITAVGLVSNISIMIIAIIISVIVMLFASKPISDFVDSNPTIKMLALSFLLMIGFTLVAEGLDFHVPKGYIYFAMAFSLVVELINIKLKKSKDSGTIILNKKMNDKEVD